jgi:hypothetical protein
MRPLRRRRAVLRVDTTGDLADVRTALLPPLWGWRQGRPIPTA